MDEGFVVARPEVGQVVWVRNHVRAALRRLAVGAAVLGAVAACATSPRPGPRASSGPASSTSPSSAVAAAPVVRTYSPYHADGTLAVEVTGTSGGSCWTSSVAAPSALTYRCLAENVILDPCFATSKDPSRVVCVADPWSPARAVRLTGPLPTPAPLPVRRPWALELANGARCTAVTGVVAQVDGVDLDYSCGSATGAGSGGAAAAGASGSLATVEYGPRTGPLARIGVTTAWRAG